MATENSKPVKNAWKKLPEDVRRAAILTGAQACFAEKGFSDTSVNDIAAAAGLTKGGLYFHFESKEAIRNALIIEFTTDVIGQARNIADSHEAPLAKMNALVLFLLNRMSDKDGLLLTLTESVSRHKVAIAELKQYYLDLSQCFSDILIEGQKDGVFKQALDLTVAVELLMTTVNGIILQRELDKAGINLCKKNNAVLDYIMGTLRS